MELTFVATTPGNEKRLKRPNACDACKKSKVSGSEDCQKTTPPRKISVSNLHTYRNVVHMTEIPTVSIILLQRP